jgi:hypothetical protein
MAARDFPGFSDAEQNLVLRLMLHNAESRERTREMLYNSERAAHERTRAEMERLSHMLDARDRRMAWLAGEEWDDDQGDW